MNLNKSIKAICAFSLSILLLASNLVHAKLTQSIDRTDIHAGESFVLTLQVDQETDEQPDLSLIPKEFTILSNSQYQQMSYINGRSSTIKGWKIKLSTLKTGNITIPSITIGNEKSQPISLVIKDTSHRVDLDGKKKAIYLESEIDNEEIYVQQQIIFTIKLYRAVNTHYARLSEPNAGDSIIEKLGDDKQYDKTIDGTRYVVTERRYAIFPQKSGELTIAGINFTADVNDRSPNTRSRFLTSTRPISVNSKEKIVKVLPQPKNSANPWMPASEVVLIDKWSSTSNELTVGEPVTWTISLFAQGLSESQLPEITLPKVSGLQFYPDTPQKERQITEQGILGQKIEKLAVIPSRAGKIVIPEVSIKWWDTKSNSEKTASIPAKTFNVVAASSEFIQQVPSEKIGPKVEVEKTPSQQSNPIWKTSTIVVSILWLLTLIAYFKKKSSTNTPSRPRRNNYSQTGNNIEFENHFKELSETENYKQLLLAIKNKKNVEIERYLLAWCSKLSNDKILTLGHLICFIDNDEIKNNLTRLQAFRYSNDCNELDFNLTKENLKEIALALTKADSKSNNDEIPPLYSN